MYHVLKRDGSTMEFDISKISAAMIKAFEAQGRNYHTSVINMLALQVTADFEEKIKDEKIQKKNSMYQEIAKEVSEEKAAELSSTRRLRILCCK